MSKNKDNMTRNRWELIKQIDLNRKGKLLWDSSTKGTYKKPEEAPTWQELMKGESEK